jgi:hypothetical protein
MKTETKKLSAQIRQFNRWRRGDEALEQPHPAEIGLMLDAAAERLEELGRQLEQERQDRKQAELDVCRALGERNDARAELSTERELADRLASVLRTYNYDLLAGEVIQFVPEHDVALAAWKEARHE